MSYPDAFPDITVQNTPLVPTGPNAGGGFGGGGFGGGGGYPAGAFPFFTSELNPRNRKKPPPLQVVTVEAPREPPLPPPDLTFVFPIFFPPVRTLPYISPEPKVPVHPGYRPVIPKPSPLVDPFESPSKIPNYDPRTSVPTDAPELENYPPKPTSPSPSPRAAPALPFIGKYLPWFTLFFPQVLAPPSLDESPLNPDSPLPDLLPQLQPLPLSKPNVSPVTVADPLGFVQVPNPARLPLDFPQIGELPDTVIDVRARPIAAPAPLAAPGFRTGVIAPFGIPTAFPTVFPTPGTGYSARVSPDIGPKLEPGYQLMPFAPTSVPVLVAQAPRTPATLTGPEQRVDDSCDCGSQPGDNKQKKKKKKRDQCFEGTYRETSKYTYKRRLKPVPCR